jgi:hypothetical protein
MRPVIVVLLSVSMLATSAVAQSAAGLDTARIESLTGVKGTLNDKEGVFKVTAPRTDLTVDVAGVHMSPAMGLTSWAAFRKAGPDTIVMGDMVLVEDQVSPVMSAALDNGLEVTALHNHFLWDSPRVMFMHIGGMGDEMRLATAVGKVFSAIDATRGGKGGAVPRADIDPSKSTLDPKRLEAILGASSDTKNGVTKFTVGRDTTMHGATVGNTMGVNTWAAFAGSDEKAVVDGDFAMYEPELQGVLKALRGADIEVVAIHQHMAGETPRVLFLHYWGLGKPADLAKGLRSALDVTRTTRKP